MYAKEKSKEPLGDAQVEEKESRRVGARRKNEMNGNRR